MATEEQRVEDDYFLPKYAVFIACPDVDSIEPLPLHISQACFDLMNNNFIPVCPHLPNPLGSITNHEYRRHFIVECDAVLWAGDLVDEDAIREVNYAKRYGIQVFFSVKDIIEFFREPEESAKKLNYDPKRWAKPKEQRQQERLQMDLFGEEEGENQ